MRTCERGEVPFLRSESIIRFLESGNVVIDIIYCEELVCCIPRLTKV